MKLCKDCKHHRPYKLYFLWFIPIRGDGKYDLCGHPKLLDQVNGEAARFCSIERQHDWQNCGDAGKLWEAK